MGFLKILKGLKGLRLGSSCKPKLFGGHNYTQICRRRGFKRALKFLLKPLSTSSWRGAVWPEVVLILADSPKVAMCPKVEVRLGHAVSKIDRFSMSPVGEVLEPGA
jgi:hypothetical protein